MSSISPQALGNGLAVYNALIPSEGPKSLPLNLDFTLTDVYRLDYQYMQAHGALSMVQSVFVDLSNTDQPMTINVPAMGQTIKLKGRTQGYYAIICPNPILIVFACPGGPSAVGVQLLNIPIASAQWPTV